MFREYRLICVSVAGVAFSCAVLAAPSDSTSVARKSIQAQYDAADAASAKKDAAGVMKIYTSDVVIVDAKGRRHSYLEMKSQATRMFGYQSISSVSTIQSISAKTSEATVKVKEHTKFVSLNPQAKTTSVLIVDSLSTDVWVKSAAGWKLKRSQIDSESATINGKPFVQ